MVKQIFPRRILILKDDPLASWEIESVMQNIPLKETSGSYNFTSGVNTSKQQKI